MTDKGIEMVDAPPPEINQVVPSDGKANETAEPVEDDEKHGKKE